MYHCELAAFQTKLCFLAKEGNCRYFIIIKKKSCQKQLQTTVRKAADIAYCLNYIFLIETSGNKLSTTCSRYFVTQYLWTERYLGPSMITPNNHFQMRHHYSWFFQYTGFLYYYLSFGGLWMRELGHDLIIWLNLRRYSSNMIRKTQNEHLKIAFVRSPHLEWKFKLLAGKFVWGVKAKHCWSLSTSFWNQKVCWHHPAMFCLITSIKLCQQ